MTSFPLVVDPLLSSSTPILPMLAVSVYDDFQIPTSGGSSKMVVEGIPPTPLPSPLSTKLLKKIRKWEYVDLSLLLEDQANRIPEE